jgi:hypothetical protein
MSIHLDNWLKRVDVDYYHMFILSWIPFNTWYVHNFYDETLRRTSDRNLIDFIKLNDNAYKSKIINLLSLNTPEATNFKTYIYELYHELENNSLPNDENRITFKKINLSKNATTSNPIPYNRKIYLFEYDESLPRTSKRFKCTIMKNNPANTTESMFELHSCKRSELEQHPEYLSKNHYVQLKLIEGFESINPKKPVNIVVSNAGIQIKSELYFVNNLDLISQVIIELIYQLRNKIFHGEVNPNNVFLKTYESAYKLHSQLIKSLN